LDLPGVRGLVTPSVVDVPAGGEASFTASLEIDSFAFEGESLAEFQWYVVADRADGTETLSMPLYFRAVTSQPDVGTGPTVETREFDGVIGPGASEVSDTLGTENTYLEIPVEVGSGAFRMVGHLEADAVTNSAYPDLDMVLFDPDGNQIGSSGNPGGVEHIDAPVAGEGTYVYRIENWLGADSSFTLTVDIHSAGAADPVSLNAIVGEYTDLQGEPVDFDGSFELSWIGTGDETAFLVERSVDGGEWTQIAQLAPSQTSLSISDAPEGDNAYRVISHYPGQVCTYVTDPSDPESIEVDRRVAATLGGSSFTPSITSASFSDGEFVVDLVITNDSDTTWLNPVGIEIIAIDGDESIEVLNADNGGNGRTTPAAFDYRDLIGNETWEPGETSQARTVRFANPKGELFTISVQANVFEEL
ncbi:MAG: hypothetical protein R3200_12160, partial [Xanthomonadales bacterium]|nr:hypothetical protein [Xanthomonadales bacterium]